MGNFKKSLYGDVEGLLSLYEASFHSTEDEPILDEARDFTSKFLKEFVNENEGNDTSLLINHALEFPLQWTVPRWEALWFINLDGGKRIGLVEELSFFRDRLVENFIWSVGMDSKPNLGNFRKVITKAISLTTVLDDVYDVYGTLEELELFTEAIDSWDVNAIDSLPALHEDMLPVTL
ncbi:Terpenoid cyclases/protein prenyltransferase alpha-alpha toroid [Sesbania bispinosa]|nr:Terpenoid cyclases/protein prenyltransferase alpha-alpha toroid [Sesbania bispinosa]